MTTSQTSKPRLAAKLKQRLQRFLGAWGVFAKGFVKHPVMVGSIIPSSGYTVQKMLAPVDWENCDVFVEYGPGVGTFCLPILENMKADARLVAIDMNPDFVDYLNRHITDSRFLAVHGSAENVCEILTALGHEHADYIVSGLPFSTLPGDVGPKIAEQTARALRPGGGFLVYQFIKRARDFMQPHFSRIDSGYSVWNILPCHLFWGWKG